MGQKEDLLHHHACVKIKNDGDIIEKHMLKILDLVKKSNCYMKYKAKIYEIFIEIGREKERAFSSVKRFREEGAVACLKELKFHLPEPVYKNVKTDVQMQHIEEPKFKIIRYSTKFYHFPENEEDQEVGFNTVEEILNIPFVKLSTSNIGSNIFYRHSIFTDKEMKVFLLMAEYNDGKNSWVVGEILGPKKEILELFPKSEKVRIST